jgi:Fic family protein
MKFENFKSGVFLSQYKYKSFSPSKINHEWIWEDAKINILLERATKAISELNAFSYIVPDIELFTRMHVMKEANASSKIEGTKTEMDDAILEREQIDPEKRDDWEEVQNYTKAMQYAIEKLDSLPLSNRLLKETHKTLMQGVRGEHKAPGEFRISQNWIGGTSLEDAVFIPPAQQELPELMSDLELFWHNEAVQVPELIKIAISHYQFETIHPFLDGNGRIGRLLITLYLIEKKFLNTPCLYLSSHLEKNRANYYNALTTVRTANNISHWVKFFLIALEKTALEGIDTFRKILDLRKKSEEKILTLGARAQNGRLLLNELYKKPITDTKKTSAIIESTDATAARLIDDFCFLGILKEITGYKRNRIYVFEEYFSLFLG